MNYFRTTQRLFETDDAVHVFDGRRLVTMSASPQVRAMVGSVAAKLDGRHGADDVAAATGLDHDVVTDVIAALQGAGLATNDEPQPVAAASRASAELAASFDALDGALTRATECIGSRRVCILGNAANELGDVLGRSGVDTAIIEPADVGELDPSQDMAVALPAVDGTSPALMRVNAIALDAGLTWLPVGGFDGWSTTVGPLVMPGESACAQCLLTRRGSNTEFSRLSDQIFLALPGPAQPAAVRFWTLAFAAQIALRWATGTELDLVGTAFTLNAADLTVRSARVFRVPRCAACHSPDWVPAAAPWEMA